jgi:hypothetical protein
LGGRAEAGRYALSEQVSSLYFRAAGFANPEVYEYLEAEGIKYAIRLPANRVLQGRAGVGAWVPSRRGLALPKSLRSGNFTLVKAVIRWMSVQNPA